MTTETEEWPECEHDSPAATFIYSNGGPYGDDTFPHTICGCGYDDTEGDFVVECVRTDAWRGYAEVRAAEGSKWVEVHDDNILAYSDDERNLKAFDDLLRDAMNEAGVEYVRAFARSSNLFSTGYTLFVEREHAANVQSVIEELKPKYRD